MEYQERMRRRYQQQYNQQFQAGREGQEDARRKVFEEVLRQQRAYEEKMRSDWFASKENLFDLHEEVMQQREELAKRKLVAFLATILGMWLIFSLVFRAFSGPEEIVVVDPVTGRRRVMSVHEFEEAERRAFQRHLEVNAGRDQQTRTGYSRPGSEESVRGGPFGQRNPHEIFPESRNK